MRIWTLKFHSQNRGSPKVFFECFWDLNGRFFIFKRNESRFGEKFPKSALFYCEKLSQSFRRFLVRYAESVESHYSRLVRHFLFPLYIIKESEMMLMKKITFNALLNHKAHNYKPMQIEVEKVIPLYGKRFEQMRDHPLEDAPEIIENRDLMYMESNTAHCILFLDANGSDGILVEAEGADYARKSQFIPNARAIIEANDITAGEHQLHQEMKKMADKIAGLAHRGEHHIYFGNLHESEIIKSLIVKSVAEMLSQRSDIADVKKHYPNIPFQPDYTVTPKPTQEMKLYCPLEIQAEPQIYETDWDAPYEDGPRAILNPFKEEVYQNGRRVKEPNEPMFTLTVVDRHGIVHQGRIRRLMPIECWRLQGFTTEQFRKVEAAGLSDAQLYKQAGNAVTVNVVEAIARNLLKFDESMDETEDVDITM